MSATATPQAQSVRCHRGDSASSRGISYGTGTTAVLAFLITLFRRPYPK